MLSIETESRLAKLLLLFSDAESSVEVTRQVLGNQIGFDPYMSFRLLDIEAKGYIDSVNLVDYLRRHSIFASSFEAQQIIYHYDADLSATLNYGEFLNLVVSEKNILLRNSSSTYKSYNPVPYDVEFSLVRLFEKELDLVKSLNNAIREINLRYDFNIIDAFRSLDILGIDNINTESVRKFLIRNFINPSEQDVVNIVKRLDVDRDYRVTYSEFKNLFSSYSAGYTTAPTNIIYSPVNRTYYSPVKTKLYCSPRRCYSPLRSYYSPVKTRTYYSPIRSSPRATNLCSSGNNNFKSSSPLRTLTSEVLSRSPKRVESPLRSKTNLGNSIGGNSTGFSNSYRNESNRYISYEEEIFLGYIKELIFVENSLESNKNEVSLKSDFNMEDVFSIFEKYNKGYISEFDLKEGLNGYFGVFPLLEDISLLFKRYDTENNASLSYGDFFNMLTPVSAEFRRLVENRVYPNSTLVGDPLSASTKFSVKNLFSNIISSEQNIEEHRRKMKGLLSFNSKKIFEIIGGYASNYFSEKDFAIYLDKNGINYLPKDIELLFIRFSRNKKGLISFSQFLDEISPKY